jgi:hypothetical protein
MYFANIKFMRIIAIISFGLMLVGLGSILVGCDAPPSAPSFDNARDDNTWMPQARAVKTKVVEIEGHKYIIMAGFNCGGIIHAESCGCKK